MRLGICTIQRDRAPWIREWVAFHYLVGFRKFYFFAHKCKDNTAEVIAELQRRYDIQAFVVADDVERPQLKCYQFAYDNFGHEVDWMAFIDGDEFLFPTQGSSLPEVLEDYTYRKLSALGVWWACFGSSGYDEEPCGLILENYRQRATYAFEGNRHIKSLVLGRQAGRIQMQANAHLFATPFGTYDESMRLIDKGFMPELEPSYEHFRINHYACQSYSFFKSFKQHSGAADAGANLVRSEQWWKQYDRNDELDSSVEHFLPALKALLNE